MVCLGLSPVGSRINDLAACRERTASQVHHHRRAAALGQFSTTTVSQSAHLSEAIELGSRNSGDGGSGTDSAGGSFGISQQAISCLKHKIPGAMKEAVMRHCFSLYALSHFRCGLCIHRPAPSRLRGIHKGTEIHALWSSFLSLTTNSQGST